MKKKIGIKGEKYYFINDFMNKIKVNNTLSEYGVIENHISIFLKNISGNLQNDPIKNIDDKLIKKIYFKSL